MTRVSADLRESYFVYYTYFKIIYKCKAMRVIQSLYFAHFFLWIFRRIAVLQTKLETRVLQSIRTCGLSLGGKPSWLCAFSDGSSVSWSMSTPSGLCKDQELMKNESERPNPKSKERESEERKAKSKQEHDEGLTGEEVPNPKRIIF